jgi:hypothetical protein
MGPWHPTPQTRPEAEVLLMTQEDMKSMFEKILDQPAPPHLFRRGAPMGYLQRKDMTLMEAMVTRAAIAVATGKKFDTQTFENLISRVGGKAYLPQSKKQDDGRDIQETPLDELRKKSFLPDEDETTS